MESCGLIIDSDGDIFLKVMYHPPILAAIMVHLYLFGDDAESQAAAAELSRVTAAL